MKGKNTFTAKEISDLKQLIRMRVNADKDDQKKIRRIMRSIGFYGSNYGIVDCQVSDLEGLIRSGVIKATDGKPVSANAPSATIRPAVAPKVRKPETTVSKAVKGVAAAEKNLLQGDFISVGALSGDMVPDVPGLYCIKLRKGVRLPAKYGKIREDGVIYIGQASTSLNQRFWRQELIHHGAATFFRSIGAMLGYLPPKGSLAGKSTRNYKFSPEDTEAIRQWMRQSLLVNCIVVEPSAIDDIEEALIRKYCPLVNIAKNPAASAELSAARDKCVAYAKVNNIPKEKPWYRRSSSWAWIVTGALVLAVIITQIMADAAEKRAKANRHKPRSYEEVFTPEEAKKMGIGGHIDGPGDWKPDPNAAKNVREFIEKGGNADPAGDAIQDGDYHDLLDQNGGPEGF